MNTVSRIAGRIFRIGSRRGIRSDDLVAIDTVCRKVEDVILFRTLTDIALLIQVISRCRTRRAIVIGQPIKVIVSEEDPGCSRGVIGLEAIANSGYRTALQRRRGH